MTMTRLIVGRNNMKVLVFADFPSPYRVEVFKGLDQEYELIVFFDKMSDQNRNSEWFCKETGLNSYNLLETVGQERFRKALSNLREYDLVLAYDYHIKNAIKLELACVRQNVPYIMNLDGAFIRKNFVKNIVKRYLIKMASGYFASGIHAAKYFKYFGAKENKIFYHPFTSLHASEIYNEPASYQEKRQFRKELGIEDRKTVISIGQFISRKGFDVLLNAWEDLDDENQLLIIGGGDDQKKYEAIIRSKGYKHVYLIGFKPKEIIFNYYRSADIFVLPTREDIWGLVINEAMACGLPVISTDMCLGAVELIEDNVNGYIVSAGNGDQLRSAIKKLITQDTYRIGVDNIKKIREYTYENVVSAHISAIKQIKNVK